MRRRHIPPLAQASKTRRIMGGRRTNVCVLKNNGVSGGVVAAWMPTGVGRAVPAASGNK